MAVSLYSSICSRFLDLLLLIRRHAYKSGGSVLNGWIRGWLSTVPYWKQGHLALGNIALEYDDIATAYASAQAVEKLNAGDYEGRFLLARCYLRRSDPGRASEILEALKVCNPENSPVCEELAAAKIALGDIDEAFAILSAIPGKQLSLEGTAALDYVKGKRRLIGGSG